MKKNNFGRFIQFGAIGDEKLREQIANAIYAQLQRPSKDGIGLTNAQTDNFATAIDVILSYPTMNELCSKDPELAENITQEILDFINKTKRNLIKTENPFENEIKLKQEFEQIQPLQFEDKWKKLKSILKPLYPNSELNLEFYQNQFQQSLDTKNSISFESVKEHFIEKWDELLYKKQTKWELEQIDSQRKKFCEELYKRIEELKKLQEALEPFTQHLGRLWDLSKGNWKRVNFDVLKRYADILQKDNSLKELAEMLGRMQQAEKEYEEELFANIQIKPEWKIEHASKADLVGIHESDDLSSLLPSEIALLADETTVQIFFKKFLEKKLQTFEYQARILSYREEEFQDKRQKEKEEPKGPFIICVDTSGSMHGTPEMVAKTLSLAILKLAIRDNRKCYLISFSTGIETLNLTDLKNSLAKTIDFLSMSFHGGTDATPAMKEALRMLQTEDYKKADVIMVSDFIMPAFDPITQEQIKSAKENKTKFHSLVIGNSQNPQAINEFDNNWFYDPQNPKSILTLVKNIKTL